MVGQTLVTSQMVEDQATASHRQRQRHHQRWIIEPQRECGSAQVAVIRDGLRVVRRVCFRCAKVDEVLVKTEDSADK
jgi:hypothetical protein